MKAGQWINVLHRRAHYETNELYDEILAEFIIRFSWIFDCMNVSSVAIFVVKGIFAFLHFVVLK